MDRWLAFLQSAPNLLPPLDLFDFSSLAALDVLLVVVAVHLGFVGPYRICSVDLAASALPLGTDLSCIPTLRHVDRGFVGCTCSLGS